MDINDLFSTPNANPNLPPKIKEAREMFNYAALFFVIAAVIYVLWGIWDIFRGLFWSTLWYRGYYGAYNIVWGIVRIALGVIAFVLKGKYIENVITPIDQGRYQECEDNLILYMILGFIFGLVLSGILTLLGYMKFQEMDTEANRCPDCGSNLRYIPEYESYYCDSCQDYKVPVHPAEPSNQPPPPGQPPQGAQQQSQYQQPEQPPQKQPQYQEPSEQGSPQGEGPKSCPTCGNEARWIEEYERYYCDNCQKYL
ncbi:MAG: hypothetical protein ACOCZJ_03050 [Thermoplasmatota archaeon]